MCFGMRLNRANVPLLASSSAGRWYTAEKFAWFYSLRWQNRACRPTTTNGAKHCGLSTCFVFWIHINCGYLCFQLFQTIVLSIVGVSSWNPKWMRQLPSTAAQRICIIRGASVERQLPRHVTIESQRIDRLSTFCFTRPRAEGTRNFLSPGAWQRSAPFMTRCLFIVVRQASNRLTIKSSHWRPVPCTKSVYELCISEANECAVVEHDDDRQTHHNIHHAVPWRICWSSSTTSTATAATLHIVEAKSFEWVRVWRMAQARVKHAYFMK